MVHVPVLNSVTAMPATVQTGIVVEAKATARPDEAVAPTIGTVAPMVLLESGPKVIVWLAGVTVKVWSTGVAAA